MAFIAARKGRKGIYVYYHDRNRGRQQQVPRKFTKHLDNATEEEIQAWLDEWEEKHGLAKQRSDRLRLADKDKLAVLWKNYQSHYFAINKRRDATEARETADFENHILPFFVGELENKKPETWHEHVPAFHAKLFESGLSDQTVRYILWALQRFGEYLVWSRHMRFPYAIQTPSRENQKVTPLQVRLEPDELLRQLKIPVRVRTCDNVEGEGGRPHILTAADIELSVLLGYFASLRPAEQWALNKEDFLTGAVAERETKTLAGFRKHRLGSKLSVVINKTWQRKKPPVIEDLAKSHYSFGVVNVWYPAAAKRIAELLRERPDGRLFPLTYYGWFQAWRTLVMPKLKVSAHDLRRASGLYLGRTKRLELTLLQEHFRHAEIETTMLYIREPEVPDKPKVKNMQDFDDVV